MKYNVAKSSQKDNKRRMFLSLWKFPQTLMLDHRMDEEEERTSF